MALGIGGSGVSTATGYQQDLPVTLSGTVASGSAIVVGIVAPANTGSKVTSVTDSSGNTYTKVGEVLLAADYVLVELWLATGVTGGAGLVVTAHDGGVFSLVQAYAYEVTVGAGNTVSVDVFNTGVSDYAGTTLTISVTTTQANDMLLAFVSKDVTTGTWTTPGSWTNALTAANQVRSAAYSRLVTTATAYSTNFVSSNNKGLAGIVVALKEVAAGTTTTTTTAASTGKVKAYVGGSFVAKPIKAYVSGSFVTKKMKRWNGSAWVATNY